MLEGGVKNQYLEIYFLRYDTLQIEEIGTL